MNCVYLHTDGVDDTNRGLSRQINALKQCSQGSLVGLG